MLLQATGHHQRGNGISTLIDEIHVKVDGLAHDVLDHSRNSKLTRCFGSSEFRARTLVVPAPLVLGRAIARHSVLLNQFAECSAVNFFS